MPAIVYRFTLAKGHTESVVVELGPAPLPDTPPDWTRLDYRQCPNCPLSPETTPHCPMALRFISLVQLSNALASYESVTVEVEMAERTVSKQTTVQRAFSSLMGLLAAASDCPHTRFLKPMAHFHLPFASLEETLYRSSSTYLLGRYFMHQRGAPQDWSLAELKAAYRKLQIVNQAMATRLQSVCQQDGTVNALIILDLLAKALPYSIDDALEELQPMFEAYWRDCA